MPASPELMLLESAGGAFWSSLLAFLVIAVVGGFLWMMKRVTEQNGAFNQQIIGQMKDIVAGMKEYKESTCTVLEKHDEQAKIILATQQETLTTLKNRPCVANAK